MQNYFLMGSADLAVIKVPVESRIAHCAHAAAECRRAWKPCLHHPQVHSPHWTRVLPTKQTRFPPAHLVLALLLFSSKLQPRLLMLTLSGCGPTCWFTGRIHPKRVPMISHLHAPVPRIHICALRPCFSPARG